jgi:hypothetical protein
MKELAGLEPFVVARRGGILLVGQQLFEGRLMSQCETNLQRKRSVGAGVAADGCALRRDRMVPRQLDAIIGVADSEQVAAPEKPDHEECENNRGQLSGKRYWLI